MLDLVQPGGPGGQTGNEERLAGSDEAGRQGTPGTPRGRYATTRRSHVGAAEGVAKRTGPCWRPSGWLRTDSGGS
jgi:hypothetical protein